MARFYGWKPYAILYQKAFFKLSYLHIYIIQNPFFAFRTQIIKILLIILRFQRDILYTHYAFIENTYTHYCSIIYILAAFVIRLSVLI